MFCWEVETQRDIYAHVGWLICFGDHALCVLCDHPSLLRPECQCHGDFYCWSQRRGVMPAADQDIMPWLLSSENMQMVRDSNYGRSLMQINSSTVPIFMYTWCNLKLSNKCCQVSRFELSSMYFIFNFISYKCRKEGSYVECWGGTIITLHWQLWIIVPGCSLPPIFCARVFW